MVPWFLAILFAAFLTVPPGRVLAGPSAPLTCQQAIGTSALRFAKRVHLAELHCAGAFVSGGTCNFVERAASIAGATQKLDVRLHAKCAAPLALEPLGFPGTCPDDDGPPFTVDDLFDCIEGTHFDRVTAMASFEFPNPAALDGDEANCQRQIGAGGARYIKQRLKFRQRCLIGQLRGSISPAVDCRAQLPPEGPGTGDVKTDKAINDASAKLAGQLINGCTGIALEDVGFPGNCPDFDGPPFTLADLHLCIVPSHAAAVDEMAGFEYPLIPTPTPTATP
jgi:hypothetical protein